MEMIHEAGQYVDTVKRVCDAVGGEVTFRGTVHRVRDMSDFSFVVMRVERGLIQCTFQGDEIGGIKRSDVKDAMVLEVTGTVREEPRAEHGVEVVLSALSILGKPYDQLPVPLGKKYMGLDFEMAYIDSMYDVMAMETGMLKSVMAYVKEHCAEELAMLNAEIPEIKEIPTIRFHEAKQIMEEKFGHKSKNRYDLNPDEEVLLCQWAKEEHDSDFVFVTHFPSAKRPFYAKDDPEDPKLALSFDLLFRGLEITTGGQRIHDYQEQMDKLAARKMNAELFESFTMLHKYGMPPHGGLGIGLERLTMQLLKLNNIREASMFPRDMNRLEP